jgi:hypothetical protein
VLLTVVSVSPCFATVPDRRPEEKEANRIENSHFGRLDVLGAASVDL